MKLKEFLKKYKILLSFLVIVFVIILYVYEYCTCCPRTTNVISSLEDPKCVTGSNHIITIKNEGYYGICNFWKRPIIQTNEIVILIDDLINKCTYPYNLCIKVNCSWTGDLKADNSATCSTPFNVTKGSHKIRIIGPSNVLNLIDFCS